MTLRKCTAIHPHIYSMILYKKRLSRPPYLHNHAAFLVRVMLILLFSFEVTFGLFSSNILLIEKRSCSYRMIPPPFPTTLSERANQKFSNKYLHSTRPNEVVCLDLIRITVNNHHYVL